MSDPKTPEHEQEQDGSGPREPKLSFEAPMHVIDRLDSGTAQLVEGRRQSDRRRWVRHAVHLVAYCQIDGVRERTESAVGDISEGGLFLRIRIGSLELGTRVRVVLELPFFDGHRICTMFGRIVRIVPSNEPGILGAGVEFDAHESPTDHELLVGFIRLWVGDGRTE